MEKIENNFIILHYKALNDTIECIESILLIVQGEYRIIKLLIMAQWMVQAKNYLKNIYQMIK